MNNLHIHGDNIVECQRALDLIVQSFSSDIEELQLIDKSIACPTFSLKLKSKDTPSSITFFPGFGRWEKDILSSIHERGGVLREAADVIVTEVSDGEENPLFAIEFCGALPAGNQAWQRSGRAYSYGAVKIPYLYISELGGYELDKDRNRKAPRLPNPAVPFSYLSFSIERGTPVFPVFVTAPGADENSRELYKNVFADQELLAFIKSVLVGEDTFETFDLLQRKVLSFVKKKAETSRGNETLSAPQWEKVYEVVKSGGSISDFLIHNAKQSWSKTAYIADLTDNAKQLMDFAKEKSIGLTSTKLPMCLLDQTSRQEFLIFLEAMYPHLTIDFKDWLKKDRPLGICWIMGFKPRGDDARPDRGLAPLARMLLGTEHDLLSIVYGPAPQSTWHSLDNNPTNLASRNGLWEAILETSDAVLIESATDENITKKGYVGLHWHHDLPERTPSSFLIPSYPTRYGENDVDTAIHILLTELCGDNIFEGMCNPPGGDWSGVSILSNEKELRWVSLPRVSGPNTKRPDHVFQFFIEKENPIILSIESKERPSTLEENIGPRLTEYLLYLFESNASIERNIGLTNWSHSDEAINIEKFEFASAGAFLSDSVEKNNDAVLRSNTDLNFVVTFKNNGENCQIDIYTITPVGEKIAKYISNNIAQNSMVKVSIVPLNGSKE
jgi:hypothetical protein